MQISAKTSSVGNIKYKKEVNFRCKREKLGWGGGSQVAGGGGEGAGGGDGTLGILACDHSSNSLEAFTTNLTGII